MSILPSGTPDIWAAGAYLFRTFEFCQWKKLREKGFPGVQTGPGPGYRVSSHVGSDMCISCGFIRTIGPTSIYFDTSALWRQHKRQSIGKRIINTVLPMHPINLIHETTPFAFHNV